jgi:hypothetical protein
MKTCARSETEPAFVETSISAVSHLKSRLQQKYEQAYPGLGDIIRFVIKAEEIEAWHLSSLFPHLILPDLVEAHLAQLGLQVVGRPDNGLALPAFAEIREHASQAVGQIL